MSFLYNLVKRSAENPSTQASPRTTPTFLPEAARPPDEGRGLRDGPGDPRPPSPGSRSPSDRQPEVSSSPAAESSPARPGPEAFGHRPPPPRIDPLQHPEGPSLWGPEGDASSAIVSVEPLSATPPDEETLPTRQRLPPPAKEANPSESPEARRRDDPRFGSSEPPASPQGETGKTIGDRSLSPAKTGAGPDDLADEGEPRGAADTGIPVEASEPSPSTPNPAPDAKEGEASHRGPTTEERTAERPEAADSSSVPTPRPPASDEEASADAPAPPSVADSPNRSAVEGAKEKQGPEQPAQQRREARGQPGPKHSSEPKASERVPHEGPPFRIRSEENVRAEAEDLPRARPSTERADESRGRPSEPQDAQATPPSVEVHIGTIEIRSDAPDPAPETESQTPPDAGPRGFEEYASKRRYGT